MKTNTNLLFSYAIALAVCGGLPTISMSQPDSSVAKRAFERRTGSAVVKQAVVGAPLDKVELDKVWNALAKPAPTRLETNWVKEESALSNPKINVEALITEANELQPDLKTEKDKQLYSAYLKWRDNSFRQQRDGYERTTGLHAVRINNEVKVELSGSDTDYLLVCSP